MKTLNEIKEILRKHKKELKEKYKVKSIAIFGSYARNEPTEKSDIELILWLNFMKLPTISNSLS
jgi:predicted nucleotidyltransferase